jgi:hypothetical protein
MVENNKEKETRQPARHPDEGSVFEVLNRHHEGEEEPKKEVGTDEPLSTTNKDKSEKPTNSQAENKEPELDKDPFSGSDEGDEKPLEAQASQFSEDESSPVTPGLPPNVDATNGEGASEIEEWAEEMRKAA